MYKFEVYRVLVSLCVEIDQIPARGEVNDKHIDYYHDLKKQIALRIQHFVEHTHPLWEMIPLSLMMDVYLITQEGVQWVWSTRPPRVVSSAACSCAWGRITLSSLWVISRTSCTLENATRSYKKGEGGNSCCHWKIQHYTENSAFTI